MADEQNRHERLCCIIGEMLKGSGDSLVELCYAELPNTIEVTWKIIASKE